MAVRELVPIVAVPADGAGWPPGYPDALSEAVATARNWWTAQLGFEPFAVRPAVAVGLPRARADYTREPNTQELIREDLAPAFPALAGQDTGTIYAVYATLGADPYTCPGDVIGTSQAVAGGPPCLVIQSSGSLDAFLLGRNPLDPTSGSRAAQTGALAHELGHALSLPHPTDPTVQALSVMWSWWTFPTCSLSPQEAQQAASFARDWHQAA